MICKSPAKALQVPNSVPTPESSHLTCSEVMPRIKTEPKPWGDQGEGDTAHGLSLATRHVIVFEGLGQGADPIAYGCKVCLATGSLP